MSISLRLFVPSRMLKPESIEVTPVLLLSFDRMISYPFSSSTSEYHHSEVLTCTCSLQCPKLTLYSALQERMDLRKGRLKGDVGIVLVICLLK